MTPAALAAVKQALDPNGAPDNGQIIGDIGKMMLAAGGIGLGARGLLGLQHTSTQALQPQPTFSPGLVPTRLPIPAMPEEEEEEKFAWTVGGLLEGAGNSLRNAAGSAARGIGHLGGQISQGVQDSIPDATTPWGKGWPIPAATLGGMGAMYGGWRAMDGVLNSHRDAKLEAEKRRAKQELDATLLGQFSNEKMGAAETSELSRDLDRLFDLLEKTASPNVTDYMGGAMGVAGTGVLLASLAAGLAGYRSAKPRTQGALVNKAMKMRQRRLANMQPTPIMAMPSYTQVPETAAI